MKIWPKCPDCGLPMHPCACVFTGNGVAAYYQREHRKKLAAAKLQNESSPPPVTAAGNGTASFDRDGGNGNGGRGER